MSGNKVLSGIFLFYETGIIISSHVLKLNCYTLYNTQTYQMRTPVDIKERVIALVTATILLVAWSLLFIIPLYW